jgi:zinc protease
MEQVNAYRVEDVKQWLTPELSKGYVEINIVGDIAEDVMLQTVLSTFGALQKRAYSPSSFGARRWVKTPTAPADMALQYESKVPQAIATTVWKTNGMRRNQREFRRLNLLAEILENRVREEIREKLGASYSPMAQAMGSDVLDAFGFLVSRSTGKPEDIELLLQTMKRIGNDLATQGAQADELERARKPLMGILERTVRDNQYWLSTVMSQSQSERQKLDLARNRDADYQSITLAEINYLARKYLKANQAMNVRIVSQTP